jgi:hypothetical protein
MVYRARTRVHTASKNRTPIIVTSKTLICRPRALRSRVGPYTECSQMRSTSAGSSGPMTHVKSNSDDLLEPIGENLTSSLISIFNRLKISMWHRCA